MARRGGAPPDPEDEARYALQNLLRSIAEVPFTATVDPGADGHRLAVTTSRALEIPPGYRLSMELLTRQGIAVVLDDGVAVRVVFDGLSTVDITPFLVLRATAPEDLTGGTVIQADLVGDPAGRLDEVLARQVDTMEFECGRNQWVPAVTTASAGSPRRDSSLTACRSIRVRLSFGLRCGLRRLASGDWIGNEEIR